MTSVSLNSGLPAHGIDLSGEFRPLLESLNPADQEILRKQIGEQHFLELKTLSKETDPELYWEALLHFGQRLQRSGHLEGAIWVYGVIAAPPHPRPSPQGEREKVNDPARAYEESALSPLGRGIKGEGAIAGQVAPAHLQQQAQLELEAIQGKGDVGRRLEFLGGQVVKDSLSYKMVIPFALGAGAYQLGRTAALSRYAASAGRAWYERGLGARFAVSFHGIKWEAPMFGLSSHFLRDVGGEEVSWDPWEVGKVVLGAGIMLSTVKGAGFGGEQVFLKIHRLNELGVATRLAGFQKFSHAMIPQVTMFGGMLASHGIETKLKLRQPAIDGATFFTDALVSQLSMVIGGNVAHRIPGESWYRYQVGLGIQANIFTKVTEQRSRPTLNPNSGLAPVGSWQAVLLREPEKLENVYQASMNGDGKGEKREVDNIITQVLDLQKKWQDVTARTSDFLRKLFESGSLVVAQNGTGKVIATFYREPLNDRLIPADQNQIYRYGGFATDGSNEGREALLQLVVSEIQATRATKRKIILKTDNPAFARLLNKIGFLPLDYQECARCYPDYLELYLAKSSKPREYYFDKKFYIINEESLNRIRPNSLWMAGQGRAQPFQKPKIQESVHQGGMKGAGGGEKPWKGTDLPNSFSGRYLQARLTDGTLSQTTYERLMDKLHKAKEIGSQPGVYTYDPESPKFLGLFLEDILSQKMSGFNDRIGQLNSILRHDSAKNAPFLVEVFHMLVREKQKADHEGKTSELFDAFWEEIHQITHDIDRPEHLLPLVFRNIRILLGSHPEPALSEALRENRDFFATLLHSETSPTPHRLGKEKIVELALSQEDAIRTTEDYERILHAILSVQFKGEVRKMTANAIVHSHYRFAKGGDISGNSLLRRYSHARYALDHPELKLSQHEALEQPGYGLVDSIAIFLNKVRDTP